MKKTLSLVLMFCMLVSVVAPALVFAETEPVNLAAGKEVLNAKVNGQNGNYCADMTDGVIADAISTNNGVWFGYWYNGDADAETIEKYSNTDENGVAIPTIDLGGSYELSSARIHIVDEASWGICAPESIVAQISDDGETFEDVVTVTEFATGVTWVDFDLSGVTAQYVRLAIDLSTSWFFLDEIEVYGVGAAGGDVEAPVEPEANVTVNVGDVEVAFDASKLGLLADGNTASDATAFSNEGLVAFENKGFTHTDGVEAAVEATFEIVYDLGEVQTIGSISLSAFKDSASMIALPTVDYYVSADGENYYQINAGAVVSPTADAAETAVATITADFHTRTAVNAKYVKAVVSFKNGWVFLSELSVGAADESAAAIDDLGMAYPYTESFVPNPGIGIFDIDDGVLDLSVNDGAAGQLFRNAQLVKAAYDAELGAYVIEYSKVNPWPDGHSGTEELAEGEILVAISTGGTITDAFSGAKWIARGLTAGDLIVLNEGTVQFLPAGATVPGAPDEPVTPPVVVEKPENAEMFWVTHYENNTVEGSGVIFTKPYDGAGWWYHVAFAPAENGAYEIVAISNGLSDGTGTALAIPEGGFVWAANYGNNYPSLGMDGPDYTSTNCFDAIERAKAWAIGDQFVVGGFDFANAPTSTPDVDWYDDAYVCTAWIAPCEVDTPDVPEPPVAGGNLAAGKNYTTTAIYTTNGVQNWPDEGGVTLTDGIKAEIGAGYSDPVWVGFNKQSPDYDASEGGFGATTVIDLGAAADLSLLKFQAFGGDAGISVPYWVNVYASVDGENYEYAGSLDTKPDNALAGVNAYEVAIHGNAQYVKVCFYGYGWIFIDEIEIYGAEGTDTPVEPEDKTYENTMVEGEDGNYTCEVPYGYTWIIDDLNGTIGGEDNTICTTQDAYNACNPNWAITIYAELQADGTYVVLQDAIVTPGSAANAGITIGENQIAIVMHSAYSNPNGANWESKVVAMSVKKGDILVVDMDALTVYAPIPGEDIDLPEPPVVEPEEQITAVVETIVNDDNTVTVNVSFAGIVSELNGVSAKLYFDSAVLKLINAADEESAIDCLVKVPDEKWENLTALSADGSYIAINVCTTENVEAVLADGNLVLSFTFAISAGYETTWIEVSDVEFLDKNIEYVYGSGVAVEIELPELDIPEEPTNVALGKPVTNADKRPSYYADLTDGVALDKLTYNNEDWFGYYWNPGMDLDGNLAQNTNAINGLANPIVDLGALYDLSNIRVNMFVGNNSGITAPTTVTVKVSADGVNYTEIEIRSFENAASGASIVEWVEFTLPEGTVAQYVSLEMAMRTTFAFINEIEIYGIEHKEDIPDVPVIPEKEESLIPDEGANWINTDNGGASVGVIYNADGSVTFTGSIPGTWPCTESWYLDSPIIADVLNDYLSIDFNVAGGSTNINFFFDDGNGGSVSFSISNTALNAAIPGASIDVGSGDLYDGTYKCTISIADLIAATMNLDGKVFPETAIIDGTVKFIGINVYSVNGATITVNDLSVVHVSDEEPEPPVEPDDPVVGGIVLDGELNENVYDNAVWFDKGVWQTIGETAPILADLDIAYTTLADAENIYLAIRVNKGLEFATALDPNNFSQAGATNFRLWFKGDGMESRTFFDVLWNGEIFETFLAKVPTDTLLYAATYSENDIIMEIKIAKETLSITDSFEMMVTYSTPYCGEGENVGYNAFHMTSFVRGEDGQLPSGWSGNTSMYESYNVKDITMAEITLGDVDGDGKISASDVTRLLNYLANYNYEDGTCDVAITDGADVTGDGVVDGRDSVRLLKYLANRDPLTGKSDVELG